MEGESETGYLFKDGKIIDFPTIILKKINFERNTGALRIRTTQKEINVDFLREIKPTKAQLDTIKRIKSKGKNLFFEILDKNNFPLKGHGGFNKTFLEMEKQIANFYSE